MFQGPGITGFCSFLGRNADKKAMKEGEDVMQEDTRYALIRKEIAVYRKTAAVFESLKPVVHEFDGKCFNRKFERALNEFLKRGKENRDFHVYAKMNAGYFDIEIHCDDDGVEEKNGKGSHPGHYMIGNSDYRLKVRADEVTIKTDSGKYRINAARLTERFDEEILYLNGKAEGLDNSLKGIESMRADIEQIRRQMDAYDKKYHYRIREVFGCCYQLRNDNSSQYR